MTINLSAITVSQTVASGATSLAVTLPATIAADEKIYVLLSITTGTADVTVTPPTGFVSRGVVYDSGSSQGVHLHLYRKTAVGTEDGTAVTFGLGTPSGQSVAMAFTANADVSASEVGSAVIGNSSTTVATGSVTTSGARRLLYAAISRVGSASGQGFTAADTELQEVVTSNTSVALYATAAVAAGTYSKTVTANIASSTGAGMIFALTEDVVSQPPNLVVTKTEGYAVLDATGSTASQGGALSYAISPTTGVFSIAAGKWAVPMSSTGPTIYTVTVTESGSGLTDNTPQVTVSQFSTGVGASQTGEMEVVRWSAVDNAWQ